LVDGVVAGRLVAVVLIAAIAGSLRLVELAGSPLLLPANPARHRLARARGRAHHRRRCVRDLRRLPVLVLVSVPPARVAPGVRTPRLVLGLAVAFSALWMTLFYPRQPGTGELAYVCRLAFGSGMAASIILGFTTICGGDVASHQAWMTRAFAVALGAGTQVFTQGIGNAVFGTSELSTDLSLGAGWAINLAVAEYVTRRGMRSSRPVRSGLVGRPRPLVPNG
jgi:hypothetical protein